MNIQNLLTINWIEVPKITKKTADEIRLTCTQILLLTFDIMYTERIAINKLQQPAPIVASSLADKERPADLKISFE